MKQALKIEKILWQQGHKHVIGIDEVGYGSFAGPTTVATVGFTQNHQKIKGINDSKTLTPNKRLHLADQITATATWISIFHTSHKLINKIGIRPATNHAILQAVSKIPNPNYILIDGNYKPTLAFTKPTNIQTITKGDQTCYSIAAASIVAKVARDKLMINLSKKFPLYQWHQNKGYGTKTHREAIIQFGPCHYHRTLFIKKTLSQSQNTA